MTESRDRFASLLTKAILTIKAKENKNIGIIQDELGYALGIDSGGFRIEHWRKGHFPPEFSDRERLARELVKRGGLDKTELKQFLLSFGYSSPEPLCEELFLETVPQDDISATIPQKSHPPRLPPLQRPPRVTYFVGRETELENLLRDLQPGRVVALCGPGGIGKSAIAAEAIWRLAPDNEPSIRFPDGILLHDFYRQPQVGIALEHIVRAFGEEPKPTPPAAAQRVLARRRILLVLEGTEQADDLKTLLDLRGGCGVLITSRRHEDAVEGWTDVSTLSLNEAETLLQKWGGLRVDDKEAVQRICELVGGLPLAVRLVGRYLAERQEEAIEFLKWLETTPLRALDHGDRQHRSVPLLLRKSLEQVSQTAQHSLAVVGFISQASFSQELVASALEEPNERILHSLGELVNYGFLLRHKIRYEVSHALIHTYARRRLVVPNDAIMNLISYYTSLTKHQSKLGQGGYAKLDPERSHLLAILDECVDRGDWLAAHSLSRDMDSYMDDQGHWTERVITLKQGLTAARKLGYRRQEIKHLLSLGTVYEKTLRRVDEAINYCHQALTLNQEIGSPHHESDGLRCLGDAYYTKGQARKAIDYYQQALVIARQTGNKAREGALLDRLGVIYLYPEANQKDIFWFGQKTERAIKYFAQQLSIARETGHRRAEAASLNNLGMVYSELGQSDKAIKYNQQALTIIREIGNLSSECSVLGNLANAYIAKGQFERAIEHLEDALTISKKIGNRHLEGIQLGCLGIAYLNIGNRKKSHKLLQEAVLILEELDSPHTTFFRIKLFINKWLNNFLVRPFYLPLVTLFNQKLIPIMERRFLISNAKNRRRGSRLNNAGNSALSRGNVGLAIQAFKVSLFISQSNGLQSDEEASLGNLGVAYYKYGQPQKAIEYLEKALAINRETEDQYKKAVWLENLGYSYLDLKCVNKARHYLEQASMILEEIKSPNVERVRDNLNKLETR